MLKFPGMFWDWFVKLMTDGEYAISWLINGGAAAVICIPLSVLMFAYLIFGNPNGVKEESE